MQRASSALELDSGHSSELADAHRRKRKRWQHTSGCRPGPCSLEEIFAWPSDMLRQLKNFGHIQEYRDTLRRGVTLHTSFSGMGCPEMAAAMIAAALDSSDDADEVAAAVFSPSPPSPKFFRAADVNKTCVEILKSYNRSCGSPSHVMGDLCKLVPETVLGRMQSIVGIAQKEVAQLSELAGRRGWSKEREARANDDVEQRVFLELLHTLQCGDVDWTEIQGHCECHSGSCPWWGGSGDALTGEIAGTTCVHWSSRGSGTGWLGDSVIPFFIWLVLVFHKKPSFVLHECTPRFDVQVFHSVLGDLYDIQTIIVSPSDVGIPSSRPRRWTVLLRKTELLALLPIDSDQFRQLFFRKVMLDGTTYMTSIREEQWAAYLAEMAHDRGFPSQDVGRPWTWSEVIAAQFETRARLADDHARAQGIPKGLTDVEQTHEFAPIHTVFPCLLRKSTIYSLFHRVCAPLEHFAPVGVPILEADTASLPRRATLLTLETVLGLSSREQKSLTGNAMHTAIAGMFLLYVLSCTRKLSLGVGSNLCREAESQSRAQSSDAIE